MGPGSSSSTSTEDTVNRSAEQSTLPEARSSEGGGHGKRGREVDPTSGTGPAPSTNGQENGKLMRDDGAPPEESNPCASHERHPSPLSESASKPSRTFAGGKLPTESKAALCAAAQVLVLAGDAAAFTKEINTMMLRPITYELLLSAMQAVRAVLNAKPAGLPQVRQHLPKALAWLVAVAVGAWLIAPADAERAGKRLLAQAEKAAANADLLQQPYGGYKEIELDDVQDAAQANPEAPEACEACRGPKPVEVTLFISSNPDNFLGSVIELRQAEARGYNRGLAQGEQRAEMYKKSLDATEEDRVAAEAQVESQRLEIARLQGQVEVLTSVIHCKGSL